METVGAPLFPRVGEDDGSPQVQEAFGKSHELFGHVSELFAVLANAPTALSGWIDMLRRLRRELELAPRLSEPAVVTVALLHGNGRVAASHTSLAVRAGVPQDDLDAVLAGRAHELPEDQALACALAAEVVAGGAASATVRRCQEVLGVRETAELVVLTSFYCMVCRVNASMDVYVGPPSEVGA